MICADTGWTWDEVGRLTLPRYRALYRRFKDHPPVHWMVAAYLGIKPKTEMDLASFYEATQNMQQKIV